MTSDMESTVLENDSNGFILTVLDRVTEQQQKIDELLCEAVNSRSLKAAVHILDFSSTNLNLETLDETNRLNSTLSRICFNWKSKQDIRPMLLAAQLGLADFIKLFLSRGFQISTPHDTSCKCQRCSVDPLGQSKQRIMVYRAISNPVWICLTCKDPFASAFQLSSKLERLTYIEDAYENEYEQLKLRCQDFCMQLLDGVETTKEQCTLMNMSDTSCSDDNKISAEKTPSLKLLKLAIHYKQKKIVAHSIPQHFITSLVFSEVPKWRTGSIVYRFFYVIMKAMLYPITSLVYILFPCCQLSRSVQQPLTRFINGAASFVTFLGLLALLAAMPSEGIRKGNKPSPLEIVIIIWLISLLIAEIHQFSIVGHKRYFSSGWNLMDIAMIFFMLLSFLTWGLLYFIQSKINKETVLLVRCLANGLFTFGTVMSFFRLVYLCQITRFLGLLQLCLGKMIEVIFQFAFISCVVLWSFSVGMVFLYNSRENPNNTTAAAATRNAQPKSEVQHLLSQGFNGISETVITLAWASLNMVGLSSLQEFDDGSIVYLWSALLFTLYYGVSMIVLLNMLIAMMSNSYQQIEDNIEVEHKFAKTQLWVDYIAYNNFLPCPFNIIPTWDTIKWLYKILRRTKEQTPSLAQCENCDVPETDYEKIIKLLVKKYLKSKHNIKVEDLEEERWKDKLSGEESQFEKYVKCNLEGITTNQTRFPLKRTTSLEDSGLDISFPCEQNGEPSRGTKL